MNTILQVCVLLAVAAMGATGNHYKCASTFEAPSCVIIGEGKLPSQKPGPKPWDIDCTLCQAKAFALRVTNAKVYLPACMGKNFKHVQVDDYKKETFCVEKDGEEIKGSRQKGMKGNCSKFPRKPVIAITLAVKRPCSDKMAAAKKANSLFVPTCKADGTFQATQCAGRWCWCAAAAGQPFPRTFHVKGKRAPNCASHQAFKFSCAGKEESVQPHPTDCARYIKCSHAGVFSCACNMGMAFDRKEGTCNHVSLVKCPKKQGQQKRRQGQKQGQRQG